ncbi:putative sulfate exporter family transporter [Fulvivirgaceae bacterium BMA10]|uniref:Sulfate exporter family transporter n=1 Tax=Splendidivirga corallicola TaxID=3051826 RepID=A0ABT8KSF0_9BACT|nr:putative sulfate exporter family transporter [Fulvivirgaceae bacterium BMA10]
MQQRVPIRNKTRPVHVKIIFVLAGLICLTTFVSGPVALIGGFLCSHFIGNPFRHYNNRIINWLLKIAVVGLGFGMNILEVTNLGREGFSLTVISIFSTLLIGFFIGKFLNVHKQITHLISSGTAICGGSAIAAISSVINSSEKDISVSLGVVFLLNAMALVIFPPIGHLFDLTEYQFGLWTAIAIHDTSSVVGASLAYGEEALQIATTVKLVRALWIVPLSLVSIFIFRGKIRGIKIPWFIFLFIGAILLNSYFPLPNHLTVSVTDISKSVLTLTLFLIGAGLPIDKIRSAGWRSMLLGISLWVFISISSLCLIIGVLK